MRADFRNVFITGLIIILQGCGGGGGGAAPTESPAASSSPTTTPTDTSPPTTTPVAGTVRVQGTISGLSASGLALALNNTTSTVSPASGAISYQFPTLLPAATTYTVAITTHPAGQTCEITNQSGVITTQTEINVPLVCVPVGTATAEPNVIIGSPTKNSMTFSVLADSGANVYVEYGTLPAAPGAYSSQSAPVTPPVSHTTNPVATVTLSGLNPNTRYYYRVNTKAASAPSYTSGNQHSFWTQRATGSTFTFAVQGDSHPERAGKMFNADLYRLTMQEVAKRQPDMYFMLGDDFSYEGPIQNFKDKYCTQFGYNCGSRVTNPTYIFTYSGEGYFAVPGQPYPYGRNLNALALYNLIPSGDQFSEAAVGENVNGVPGYTPLTTANSTRGYGTYLEQRLRYLNLMGHSTSLFLVNGNHEQTAYANLGSIFNNAAVWAAAARNKFYANPVPGTGPTPFYTGDTENFGAGVNGFPGIPGDGLLRDYYAFTWGDALFVTLDPYWHSPFDPDSSLFDISPEPEPYKTMGLAQFNWLKTTLTNSNAKYKFIFQHHILGNGRGAARMITTNEWGGQSNAGFNFLTDRAGWDKPVHQLLVDTMTPGGQTIVFTAHDHIYGREMVDGVVYQSVPNPADNSYWAYNCSQYAPASVATFPSTWKKADNSSYGVYDRGYSIVRPNTGFLMVSVAPESVRVDYIRTFRQVDLTLNSNAALYDSLAGHVNGETDFRYSLPANPALDSSTASFAYTCKGDAPPGNFIYNP